MSKLSLSKYQKIELVRMIGLNTEDNILIKSIHPEERDRLKQFLIEHDLKSVSVRTMSPKGETRTPHHPIVEFKDIPNIVTKVLCDGYYAIVATPIDPKDSLLAGAVMKNDNTYISEFARGPCTVRKVTHEGKIDIEFEYHHRENCKIGHTDPPIADLPEYSAILAMMSECVKIPFSKCIIELSYYNIPVGHKKERIIIWDIDSDGTTESTQSIESYYHIRKLNSKSE